MATMVAGVAVYNQGGGLLSRELVEAIVATGSPVRYYSPDAVSVSVAGADLRCRPMPRHRNTSAGARLRGWASFMLSAAGRILSDRDRPLLFLVSNPPLSPLLGFAAKKLRRQSYALLYYDIYPEALMRFGGIPERSPVVRLWRALNRVAIRHADSVITISPHMARTLAQYTAGRSPRAAIHIVPTWVDTAWIRPIPKEQNDFARQHGQIGKLTLLYSGNLGLVHDLTILPAVAARLAVFQDIHFVVIGEGAGRKSLEAECAQRELRNVTFLPLQPESVLPYSLAMADIGLVALAAGAEGISMPSKTYYMMAAGSALLGLSRDDSDLASVIAEHGCGVNAGLGDPERVARAVLSLRDQPDRLRACRQRARQAAETRYSRTVCVSQLVSLIQSLTPP